MYISMFMSFVYSIMFIYLMSWFAEYIAWAIVILVQLGFIGGALFGIGAFLEMKKAGQSVDESASFGPN